MSAVRRVLRHIWARDVGWRWEDAMDATLDQARARRWRRVYWAVYWVKRVALWLQSAANALRERLHPTDEYTGAGDDAATGQWLHRLHDLTAVSRAVDRRPRPDSDEWYQTRWAEMAINRERQMDMAWQRILAAGARLHPDWAGELVAADAAQRDASVKQHRRVALAMESTGELPRVLAGVA